MLIHCSYLKRAYQTSTEFDGVLKQSRAKKLFMKSRGLSRGSSSLAIACYIDCCSELLMDALCLLINLWMVYGASKPLDMVLNSLALEFIKSIGDHMCCSSCSFIY